LPPCCFCSAGYTPWPLCLKSGYAQFEYVLGNLSTIFLIVVPILTMRVMSEEKRQKTDMLLYSLPTSMTRVVLGKFLAAATVLLLTLTVMCAYPPLLSIHGNVNMVTAYGGIFAFFLLGSSLISMGMLISSLTESQAVSAGLCFSFMLLNYYLDDLGRYLPDSAAASFIAFTAVILVIGLVMWHMSKHLTASLVFALAMMTGLLLFYKLKQDAFAGLFASVVTSLCVFSRFEPFMHDIFDLKSIVYYLSVISIFLFLTIQSMEKRRWS
jgi:ABC-2 type transport system permease protein